MRFRVYRSIDSCEWTTVAVENDPTSEQLDDRGFPMKLEYEFDGGIVDTFSLAQAFVRAVSTAFQRGFEAGEEATADRIYEMDMVGGPND
jgi:hypothetical protein